MNLRLIGYMVWTVFWSALWLSAMLFALSLLVEPWAFVVAIVAMVFSTLLIVILLIDNDENTKKDDILLVSYYIIFALAFGLFCRSWNRMYGGFDAHGDDFIYWARFSAAWVFDNLFGSFNQIYGTGLSDVRPTTTLTETFVFVWNLLLEFLVVSSLFTFARRYFRVARRRSF